MPAATTLARLVLLEARRGGLPWLGGACVLLSAGLAGFLSEVAITEGRALQAALVGALLRACAVFLIVALVSSATLREINDKGLEILLSFPLSRATQYLGRFAGFSACALVLAALFAAPLLWWASPASVALWGLSLAFECIVAAAAALFFSMALAQLVPAIAASVGFYLLSRSIGTIQAIAAGPLTEPDLADRVARGIVDTLALLLPHLDSVTQTRWLLYGAPPAGAYACALAGLALYALVLVAAGLFDFYRRSV